VEQRLATVRAIQEERADRAPREEQRRHHGEGARRRGPCDQRSVHEEEEREGEHAEVRDVVIARAVLRPAEGAAETRPHLHDPS
jgi:hypothetical protein